MKRRNPFREAIAREIEDRHPDVGLRFETRGKHESAVFTYRGRERFTVFPCTPSEYRGLKNKVCEVRRILRDMKGAAA